MKKKLCENCQMPSCECFGVTAIERGDIVMFNGREMIAKSRAGSTMFVSYPDGGIESVDADLVTFVRRPTKTGARFQRWEDGKAIYLLPLTNDLARGRKELEKIGFDVPETPAPSEWRKAVESKRRCGRCWKTLRGTNADRQNHLALHQSRTFLSLAFAIAFSFLTVGCNGVDRLINGPDSPDPKPVDVIVGGDPLPSEAPEFNLAIPDGFTRVVHFGPMPADGRVSFAPVSGSLAQAFIYQSGPKQWFMLGTTYSGAFYYSHDAAAGVVQYHGNHLSGTAYCVYQYVPAVQP